jgi:NADPH:quinone reductase-like Zn-dependent oxidoreductase
LGTDEARLSGKRFIGGVASEAVELLRKIVGLAEDGHFHPVIDRCYDFSQMIAAHAHVDTGRKKGNVVITIAQGAGSCLNAGKDLQLGQMAHV